MAAGIGARERVVEVGGQRIGYQETGNGPDLVLIHGLAGSAQWWARNIGPLSEHFHVLAVDLIGFGSSRGARFELASAAGILCSWLDELGIKRVAIAGHSMGGLVALDLAATVPERVERLVLVDAAVYPPESRHRLLALGLLRQARYVSPAFMPLLLRDTARAGPRALLAGALGLFSATVLTRLDQVRAPALLVWGEHDMMVPLAVGEELVRRLPGARLVVIPQAGHNPMWDQPDAFNRLVLEFLLQPSAASESD